MRGVIGRCPACGGLNSIRFVNEKSGAMRCKLCRAYWRNARVFLSKVDPESSPVFPMVVDRAEHSVFVPSRFAKRIPHNEIMVDVIEQMATVLFDLKRYPNGLSGKVFEDRVRIIRLPEGLGWANARPTKYFLGSPPVLDWMGHIFQELIFGSEERVSPVMQPFITYEDLIRLIRKCVEDVAEDNCEGALGALIEDLFLEAPKFREVPRE